MFFKKDYGSQLRVQEKCMDQVQRSSPALILPPWQQALCSTIEHKDPRTSVLMAPADKNPEGKEHPGWLAPSNLAEPLLEPPAHHRPRGPARGRASAEGPGSRRVGRSCPCSTGCSKKCSRMDEAGGRPAAWGPAGEPWPAPGRHRARLRHTWPAGRRWDCAPLVREETPFTSAAFQPTQNVCAFIKVP